MPAVRRNHARGIAWNIQNEQSLSVALQAHRIADDEAVVVVEDGGRGRSGRCDRRRPAAAGCSNQEHHQAPNDGARSYSHDPVTRPATGSYGTLLGVPMTRHGRNQDRL